MSSYDYKQLRPLALRLYSILQLVSHRSLLFDRQEHLERLVSPLTTVWTVVNALEQLKAMKIDVSASSSVLKRIQKNIPEEWVLNDMEERATCLAAFAPQLQFVYDTLKGSAQIPDFPGTFTREPTLLYATCEKARSPGLNHVVDLTNNEKHNTKCKWTKESMQQMLDFFYAHPHDYAGFKSLLETGGASPTVDNVERAWRTLVIGSNAGLSSISISTGIAQYAAKDGQEWEKDKGLLHDLISTELVRTMSPDTLMQKLNKRYGLYLHWNNMQGLMELHPCFAKNDIGSLRHIAHRGKRENDPVLGGQNIKDFEASMGGSYQRQCGSRSTDDLLKYLLHPKDKDYQNEESTILSKLEHIWSEKAPAFRGRTGVPYNLLDLVLQKWISKKRKTSELLLLASNQDGLERLLTLNDVRIIWQKWRFANNMEGIKGKLNKLLSKVFSMVTETTGMEKRFKNGIERYSEDVSGVLRM